MADIRQHKKTLWITIGVCVVGIGGFGWFGYQDWLARDEAITKIASTQTEIERSEQQIRSIPELEERVIALRESVKECARILPDDKEINSFVQQLTEFASKAGVRIIKLDDEDARVRSSRNKKGATATFDRVVYKISLEGQVEQVLRFMDLFEGHERFVRISTFKIVHHAQAQPGVDALTIPHQVDIELETYVYNPKTKNYTQVEIPQEAMKVEKLRQSGKVPADPMAEVHLAVYHRDAPRDRRDIFLDPRLVGDKKAREAEAARKKGEEVISQFAEKLKEVIGSITAEAKIENTVRRLQQREKTDQLVKDLGASIAKHKAETPFTDDKLKERFSRDVERPFDEIVRARASGDDNTAQAFAVEHLQDLIGRMKTAGDEGRWEDVVSVGDEVGQLKRTAPDAKPIQDLFKQAENFERVAKIHIEFKSRSYTFGGAVCYQSDPTHAVVIINGRPYSPGETVDGEVRVKTITPAEVTFEFRGVTLTEAIKSSVGGTPNSGNTNGARKKTSRPGVLPADQKRRGG